jgi:hypothetical protein
MRTARSSSGGIDCELQADARLRPRVEALARTAEALWRAYVVA